MFNSCTQEPGKKFDAYLIKLRLLIKMCEYGALENELLHDQIVTGTSNNNVWARFLSKSGLTPDWAIDIRSTEWAEQQLGKLNNSAETMADKKRHENSICLKRNHIAGVCQSQMQPTPPQWPNKSSTQ